MSISIPETSGGCGATHLRPVTRGAPAKIWELTCPRCEAHLRGDSKQKIIKTTPGDKDRGIPARLDHVPDADPHWSNTPEGVPLTPDEQNIYKLRAEQGRQQLDMLQAYAALSKVPGLDLKDFAEAKWMLDQTLDPLKRPVVKGTILCADGHENDAGAKFCGECGVKMTTRGVVTEDPDVLVEDKIAALPLGTLHVSTLKKIARSRGVPDKGTKAELIERLTV